MTNLARVLLVVLFALTAACGKRNADVFKENAPAFDAMRAKLKEIGDGLPAAGSVSEVKKASLDPTPEYVENGGNMDIFMAEQLTDPDKMLDFDLLLAHALLNPLLWTGPKNPMSDSAMGERGTGLEEDLKRALDLRYLAIVRIVSFNKPIVANNTFSGGELKAEVFIADLTNKKVTPIGPIEAKPSDSVNFTYKQGESPEDAAKRFIQSTVWTDARNAVKKLLEDAAGAKVTIK